MSGQRQATSLSGNNPAAGAGFSFAGRLEQVVTPQIHNWANELDISARLVHFDESVLRGLEPSSSSTTAGYSPSMKSGSSMALTTLIHQSNAPNYPPSLRSYCTNTEATPTESSISTGLASHFSGVRLLEDNNGNLEIPQTQIHAPVYECAFWFLSCNAVFVDKEYWETHCLAHFHGEEPPRSVQCPLCEWTITSENGWSSWSSRMEHLALAHTMLGQTLRTSRPDFGLYDHLWQKRLIDTHDLKELKGGNHNLTNPLGNVVETNGRGGRRERDNRRHRTQHVTSPRQLGLRRA